MGVGSTAAGNRWVRIKQRLVKDKGLVKRIEKWIMVA
jgi:hypothetical protein